MKVLLVRPPRIKQAVALGEFMYSEPIGLEMVYTMLEDSHQVEILDLMSEKVAIEDKMREFKPQVVGITTLCIDVPIVKDLAERVKGYDPSIMTVIGGTQTFLNSKAFFIDSVDHVMKYTTTNTIKELFGYLEREENPPVIDGICSRVNKYKTTSTYGINEYVRPNRASTSRYRRNYTYFGYKPCAIMGTAQGCSKVCRFCLRWRIEGPTEKYFSMDSVKDEIKSIQEENIMIFDNDFLHNSDRIKELCDFLEKEQIYKNFICYASVNSILKNKEAIKRFRSLGLKAVLLGYETFKDEELQKYEKKSSVQNNVEANNFTKEIGLDVWASFMIHPDWSIEDFKSFRRYIKILNPETSTFSPLTPFPNLPLYQEYGDRLLVTEKDYERWSFGQVTVMPSNMSLRRYYLEILKTNLYVNLPLENIKYLTKRFGIFSIFRLFRGSVTLFIKYIKLMLGY